MTQRIDQRRVIVRVEGDDTVGHGHFIRCLTIARYISPALKCTFAMSTITPWVREQLEEFQINCIQLPYRDQFHPDDERSQEPWSYDLADILENGDILLVDGYRFDHTFHHNAQATGAKTIWFIDDLDHKVYADAIITQLPVRHDVIQAKLGISTAWTGLDGFLVRPEFYEAQDLEVPVEYDYFIYASSREYAEMYRHRDELKNRRVIAVASENSEQLCRIAGWESAKNLSAREMAGLMRKSQNAILPASSIALEYYIATARNPYVFSLAQNQYTALECFTDIGMWRRLETESKRNEECGFVDGNTKSIVSSNLTKWMHGTF